jgi:hypothetical protein
MPDQDVTGLSNAVVAEALQSREPSEPIAELPLADTRPNFEAEPEAEVMADYGV